MTVWKIILGLPVAVAWLAVVCFTLGPLGVALCLAAAALYTASARRSRAG